MSIFPTKILLATDGSLDAQLALRAAAELTNSTDSELHVVTVGGNYYHPGVETAARPDLLEETLQELERKAKETLDEQTVKIEEVGATVTQHHLRMGKPAEEIVSLAEEMGAGLIAMGSRGLEGIRRALMGSVSDSVVRHAPCPVLVARKAEEEQQTSVLPTKILLATDGSEEAELALTTVIDLAEKTDSELHVVHVGRLLGHAGGAAIARGPLPSGQDTLDREARRLLDSQVKKVEAAGGTVAHAHLRSSERPDAGIVAVAEEIGAGLIAMGSRGLGPMRRLLLGSVSDSVVRHAHCPVLVVREERPQGPAGVRRTEGEQT